MSFKIIRERKNVVVKMNAIFSTNLLAVFKRKIKSSWREPWRFGCKMGAVNAKIKLQQKEKTLT